MVTLFKICKMKKLTIKEKIKESVETWASVKKWIRKKGDVAYDNDVLLQSATEKQMTIDKLKQQLEKVDKQRLINKKHKQKQIKYKVVKAQDKMVKSIKQVVLHYFKLVLRINICVIK